MLRSWTKGIRHQAAPACLVSVALLALGPMTGVSAAKVKGPKRVTPGKIVTFVASGLPANTQLSRVRIEPTVKARGFDRSRASDGRELSAKRFRTNASGRVVLRFRFPTRRLLCGFSCGQLRRWTKGSSIDVYIHLDAGRRAMLTRRVSRIAGAKPRRRSARAKLHRCGTILFQRGSGEAMIRIVTRGIGCTAARKKLRAWRNNRYRPRTGPRGYRCTGGGPFSRTTCRRAGRSVPVIAFTSGD